MSVSRLVERNVNDEDSLPLVSVSKGCASLLSVENDVHMNPKRTEVAVMTEIVRLSSERS